MTSSASQIAVSDPISNALDVLGCGCSSPEALTDLLREDAAHFHGRGRTEVESLRAFLMARLADRGLADAVVPFAREELQTGQTAHGLAAAAKVMRLTIAPPEDVTPLIENALDRLRLHDRHVDLSNFPPIAGQGTSALSELKTALGAVSEPSCCSNPTTSHSDPLPLAENLASVTDIEVENQNGDASTLGTVIADRVCLIAFFYTRCANPLKCSRTVSLLGEQDVLLRAQGSKDHRVIGISYEPDYDVPNRLASYGADRGLVFSETCQLLRTRGPITALIEGLNLGVGFGESTINAHRLEWLVCDRAGHVMQSGTRSHWNPEVFAKQFSIKVPVTKRNTQ